MPAGERRRAPGRDVAPSGGPPGRCPGWPARAGRCCSVQASRTCAAVAPCARATATHVRRARCRRCPGAAARSGDREERHERDALLPAGVHEPCSPVLAPRKYRFCTQTTGATAWAWASCPGVHARRPRGGGSVPPRGARRGRRSARRARITPGMTRRFTTSRWSRPSWRRFSSTWPRSWSGAGRGAATVPDGSRPGPTLVTMTRSSGYGASAELISSLAERSGEK